MSANSISNPKRRVGRPTKLTPEAQEKICSAIRAGNYVSVAVQYANVSAKSHYEWMVRGERGESPFREYREAIKKAESDSEVARVATIVKASAQQWQAAAWWLERKLPDRWGRRDRTPIPWQQEVIDLIRSGAVTPAQVKRELGDDLYAEFFKFAGAVIASIGETEAGGAATESE